jgi:hypothetical protein
MKLQVTTACLLAAVSNATVINFERAQDQESFDAQWPDLSRAWNEFKEMYKKTYRIEHQI